MGRGGYSGPADLVVDNRSDLIEVVAAPMVGQGTYRDAREPIYDVFVADVRQAGHVGRPGSIEARRPSGQVPLIDHDDIVEMLHGPIYIRTGRKSPLY